MSRFYLFCGYLLLALRMAFALPAQADPNPPGITAEQMTDAYPSRDPANVANWYGTSLFGWDECDKKNKNWKALIKEAYADANKLVNLEGVKKDIDWESAAALEYLGPSAFNTNQQKQIQAVFENVATVKEGANWYTPNWIRARCDDPEKRCTKPKDDPCPGTQEDEDLEVVGAYARNPAEAGGKYPDINFCPQFFDKRSLSNALRFGTGFSNPTLKFDLGNYASRGSIFLHELMHLDLAANSANGSPNPKIRDLLIRYQYTDRNGDSVRSKWTRAYGPSLSKILARFQPISPVSKQTGWFVQRNVDNLVHFAMANYVAQITGGYPFLPVIYDKITDSPMLPPGRASVGSFVVFAPDADNPASLVNFTDADSGSANSVTDNSDCPSISDTGSGEDLEIGPPIPADRYPQSYWDQRASWLELIRTDLFLPACKLNLVESWTCGSAPNLYALVSVTDPDGKLIYSTPQAANGPGQLIDNKNALGIQAIGLNSTLNIQGYHEPDEMSFAYGDYFWTSQTTAADTLGPAYCSLNGPDWDGDSLQGCPNAEVISREFNCQWPC